MQGYLYNMRVIVSVLRYPKHSMKLSVFDKHQSVFGLDIGSHEAKYLQLRANGKHLRVLGLGQVTFDDTTVIEGVLAEPEQLAATLLEGIHHPANGHISAKAVAISLPQSHLFTRLLTLPAMETHKLRDAVNWESQQYIPMPANDLYTDYEIIATARDDNGKAREHDILVVASPRAIVDSYMKLLEFLHVTPHSMEMSLGANIRALRKSNDVSPVLVVDAGSVATDMAIVTDTIRLTTTVNIGGDSLSAALSRKLKLKEDEAEEVKVKFGIAPSGLQPKIQSALATPLKSMATEINKLLKYYEERSGAKDPVKIQRILMTGGASRMPGLAHFISQATKLTVDISSPWDTQSIQGIKNLPGNLGPVYTTAFGLAMREVIR